MIAGGYIAGWQVGRGRSRHVHNADALFGWSQEGPSRQTAVDGSGRRMAAGKAWTPGRVTLPRFQRALTVSRKDFVDLVFSRAVGGVGLPPREQSGPNVSPWVLTRNRQTGRTLVNSASQPSALRDPWSFVSRETRSRTPSSTSTRGGRLLACWS